jgi:hypothetical protein
MKRVTPENPGQSEVSSFYYTVLSNSKGGIGGTRRRKATRGRQKGRYGDLIDSDKGCCSGSRITKKEPHF